ncbi:unnamed protein product [Sphagnum jensenii]|uniref:S-acyltransferase n=1 Tax=Sphagnum jensenii TaxID=128206 RepID=A0ABP0VHI9_9BRYO
MVLILMQIIYTADPGVITSAEQDYCMRQRNSVAIINSVDNYRSFSYNYAISEIYNRGLTPLFTSSADYCCHFCRILRPFRAGHSSVTGRCVRVFDHFCFLLGADVGKENYALFVSIISIMTILAMPLFLVLFVNDLYSNGCLFATAPSIYYQLLKCYVGWTLFMWLLISFTLGYHVMLMSYGLTTGNTVILAILITFD